MERLTREPARVTEALEFVRRHDIVLASANGDAPRLIEAILGEPISGNWWTHPRGRFIYNVLSAVSSVPCHVGCGICGHAGSGDVSERLEAAQRRTHADCRRRARNLVGTSRQ